MCRLKEGRREVEGEMKVGMTKRESAERRWKSGGQIKGGMEEENVKQKGRKDD